MTPLRIGTRGSPLALWQANYVADRLRSADVAVELVEIETSGDRDRTTSLSEIGGEGVFTKAIQQALLDNRVDVAVHSLKDLPTIFVPDLVLAGVPPRGPTGDALVSERHASLASLPAGAVVASSNSRRRAQLRHHRPDLQLVDIRGNVDTRLRKMREQNLDAIILAQAGLERLGLSSVIKEILDASWMLPAVGQGALGLECRAGDDATRAVLSRLDDAGSHQAVLAERAFLRGLGGGCLVPIGAAAHLAGTALTLRGVVLDPDGSRRIDGQLAGAAVDAEALGSKLAEDLLARGARELLSAKS